MVKTIFNNEHIIISWWRTSQWLFEGDRGGFCIDLGRLSVDVWWA